MAGTSRYLSQYVEQDLQLPFGITGACLYYCNLTLFAYLLTNGSTALK